MIASIVMGTLLIIACIVGIVMAIADGEHGAVIICVCGLLLGGLITWSGIDACKEGNQENVELRFPSEHYTLSTEVTVTERVVIIDGESTIITTRDTTYVITGIEPIFGCNNYERKVSRITEKQP